MQLLVCKHAQTSSEKPWLLRTTKVIACRMRFLLNKDSDVHSAETPHRGPWHLPNLRHLRPRTTVRRMTMQVRPRSSVHFCRWIILNLPWFLYVETSILNCKILQRYIYRMKIWHRLNIHQRHGLMLNINRHLSPFWFALSMYSFYTQRLTSETKFLVSKTFQHWHPQILCSRHNIFVFFWILIFKWNVTISYWIIL